MDEIERKISSLDLSLFSHIDSQSTANDKTSLLALQGAVRQKVGDFCWLEIGSHLGGSLQSLVVDPRCTQVVSIDPRPPVQPDERGPSYRYEDNSTQRMLNLLGQIPGARMEKIKTVDAGTDTLQPSAIKHQPDLCFVDGEHTDSAALRDARFCLSVISPEGCIAFHDAQIIYRGLLQFVGELAAAGREFRAYNLPDSIFAIELGGCRLSAAPQIRAMLDNNHLGYLWSLNANDEYRHSARRPIVRAARWIDGQVQRVVHRLR
jgi:hypothetical protein